MKYDITKLKIENFGVGVPDKDLLFNLGKAEYKRLQKWLRGQTCPLGGVYPHDLERYLYYRKQGIKAKDIEVLD